MNEVGQASNGLRCLRELRRSLSDDRSITRCGTSPARSAREREGILSVHTRKIPLSEDVDRGAGAWNVRLSGADLANLVNEAALKAARDNRTAVRMIDFELGRTRC